MVKQIVFLFYVLCNIYIAIVYLMCLVRDYLVVKRSKVIKLSCMDYYRIIREMLIRIVVILLLGLPLAGVLVAENLSSNSHDWLNL